ncbi:MAG TPA: hypothetical protein VFL87_00325 [Thermoleophilaceae bacterium]|nr:hypothetical protein [Thermoleophilaceae bacterium]
MADWATISSLATAGGTLVLAVATFASVRSANRSARVAERSLLLGLRPVLIPTYETDRPEEIVFGDEHSFRLHGATAAVEEADGNVYLAIPLRNVGAGLAVLHGWHLARGRPSAGDRPPDLDRFRQQFRDLYIPAGDTGYWQGGIRDESDPFIEDARAAALAREPITIDLLYGDWEGGQRTISRFVMTSGEGVDWPVRVVRHWRVEEADSRLT